MIAEDYLEQYQPTASIPKGTLLTHILNVIKEAPTGFRLALTTPGLTKPLNENKLTQILVEQINYYLAVSELPIKAQNQYSDVFHGTKGIPDFYFHLMEMGRVSEPLFVVEAKILPAPPPKGREKEYVIGSNASGGIQRFKMDKHGKGQSTSGMVGFLESEDKTIWKSLVNSWILNQTKIDTQWKSDEILVELEDTMEYIYLASVVHKVAGSDLRLHHFWIK